jgi:hypothetical protein
MIPSIPRLSTPARSQISSPRVAKISGEAMRIAAAHRLASKMMLTASMHYLTRRRKRVNSMAVTIVSKAVATITLAM